MYNLGAHKQARQRYEGSLALYWALGHRWAMASVSYHLGDLLQITGAFEEAKALLREGLAIQQELGDRRGMAGSLRVLGVIATGEESHSLARESVAAFRAIGDRSHAAEALINLGTALMVLGDLARARSELKASVAIYRDLGFSGSSSSMSLAVLGWVDALLGRHEEARASAQAALALSREDRYWHGIGGALTVLGQVAIAEEEYAQARQVLQQACSELEGSRQYRWVLSYLGYALRGLGQHDGARRHLYEAIEGDVVALRIALPALALLFADRGEVEQAVELYAMASRYPFVANAQWFEDVAGRHIIAAAAILPPDVVAAAQERGRARDLQATVQELRDELGDGQE
jgi:tetratricopeptide (TPR) repeat protein